MHNEKAIVIVPTYNERSNVESLVERLIQSTTENTQLLFVDDNSPDGTGTVLDAIASRQPRLQVMHRAGKLGVGSAHVDALNWAYDRGYCIAVTMDADFTHSPEKIAELIAMLDAYDLVTGTRFESTGSLEGWNFYRKSMTNFGHFLTGNLLGLPYDCTGAFRAYRLDRIPRQFLSLVESQGYSFFIESIFVLSRNNFSIGEVPITLPARTYGTSKMTLKEVLKSVRMLARLSFQSIFSRQKFLIPVASEYASLTANASRVVDSVSEWDTYWSKKKGAVNRVYDLIASLYRIILIRPTLKYYLRMYFPHGTRLLHAGCGGGQVDTGLHSSWNICALDISAPALALYRHFNGIGSRTQQGTIFSLPFEKDEFDGIYNLGVMEHFDETDIAKILREFHRVLRPGGSIVLFWPPEYGSSVMFLKVVHRVLHMLMGKEVQLHPDEISRIQSRNSVRLQLERAGFEFSGFHFGPRDFFTYAIVAGKKNASESSNAPELIHSRLESV